MTPENAPVDGPFQSVPSPQPHSPSVPSDEAALARLALLHGEAVETARLANILGRTPGAAGFLLVLSLGIGVFLFPAMRADTTALSALMLWVLFVGAGVLSLFRLYRHASRPPFDLATLRTFAADSHALFLYAGFAWGAGVFLALPPDLSATALIAFSTGATPFVGAIMRARAVTLYFLVPAAGLPILAALTGPSGLLAAALILVLAVVIGFGTMQAEQITARRLGVHPLPQGMLS